MSRHALRLLLLYRPSPVSHRSRHGPDQTCARSTCSRSARAHSRRHPPRSLRPLPRQQRPALLPPRHPRRSRTRTITGKNTIRFRMLADGTRIQIDLSDARTSTRSSSAQTELKYKRDSGAVFIDFPDTLRAGQDLLHRLLLLRPPPDHRTLRRIHFKQRSRRPSLDLHLLRRHGASIWWPNKDQWRDELETMDISVAIPNGLTDVSNGKFIGSDRSRRRLHPLGLARQLPHQQLRRCTQHRQLRPLLQTARHAAPRLLRPP